MRSGTSGRHATSSHFRRGWLALGLLTALLVGGLLFSGPGAGRASSQEACDPGYATTHILLKMEPDAPAGALEAMKALNGEGAEYEIGSLGLLWNVSLPVGMTVPETVSLYESAEGVEYAHPDYAITPAGACEEDTSAPWVRLAGSPDQVRVGGTLTYEATVTNSGPQAAKDVKVLTGAPENARLLSSRFVNGDATGSCPPPEESGRIRCGIGDVPVDGSATVTLQVRPTTAGILWQYATVSAANAGTMIEPVASSRIEVLPARETRFGACTILGTPAGDVLKGTLGRDVICGAGGGDTLLGEDRDDVLIGDDGNDTLVGGSGGDRLLGSDGADTLRSRDGTGGNDSIRGGAGDDRVIADPGDDTLPND